MASALTVEHYTTECFVKCAQVILSARLPPKPNALPDKRSSRWVRPRHPNCPAHELVSTPRGASCRLPRPCWTHVTAYQMTCHFVQLTRSPLLSLPAPVVLPASPSSCWRWASPKAPAPRSTYGARTRRSRWSSRCVKRLVLPAGAAGTLARPARSCLPPRGAATACRLHVQSASLKPPSLPVSSIILQFSTIPFSPA